MMNHANQQEAIIMTADKVVSLSLLMTQYTMQSISIAQLVMSSEVPMLWEDFFIKFESLGATVLHHKLVYSGAESRSFLWFFFRTTTTIITDLLHGSMWGAARPVPER